MPNADDRPRSQLPLRIAAALYGVGMLILMSPVQSTFLYSGMDEPRVGELDTGRDGSSLCGLTMTAAFVSPAETDSKFLRKADCAGKASDRVGFGLLSLALVVAAVSSSGVRLRPRGQRGGRGSA